MKKDSKSESSANLRKQAEALNRKRPLKSSSRPDDNKMRKLIQELETHQIELESQNEELRLAKAQITADAVKYAELYDFAPSGYFTLANNSEIIELNLCGSQMLGKERMFLKTQQFGLYVSDDDKTVFNRFLDKVFHNKSTETCEVALLVNGNPPIYVNLSGTATENGEQCLVIATDITSSKQAEVLLSDSFDRLRKIASRVPGVVYQFRLRPDGSSCFLSPAKQSIRSIGSPLMKFAKTHPRSLQFFTPMTMIILSPPFKSQHVN